MPKAEQDKPGVTKSRSLAYVANALGISIFTVRREIKRGNLPAFYAGKRMRVDDSAVAEYKARRSVPRQS